jgi:hypothetical protein
MKKAATAHDIGIYTCGVEVCPVNILGQTPPSEPMTAFSMELIRHAWGVVELIQQASQKRQRS